MFSSPQRGSFLSTSPAIESMKNLPDGFSSPQRGSFLSTATPKYYGRFRDAVFVPSTGFFSIYAIAVDKENMNEEFSSPQRGSFLSTLPLAAPGISCFPDGFAAETGFICGIFPKNTYFLQNPLFYGLRGKILF